MLHKTNSDRTETGKPYSLSQNNSHECDTASTAILSPTVSSHDILSHTETTGNGQTGQKQPDTDNMAIWDKNLSHPVTVYKRKKYIPDSVIANKYQSLDHKNCINQNTKAFGFVPYNDLLIYTGPEIVWANVPDIVQAHQLIRQSAMPNFMQVRIPVKSQLKVEVWKKYLDAYWDKQ